MKLRARRLAPPKGERLLTLYADRDENIMFALTATATGFSLYTVSESGALKLRGRAASPRRLEEKYEVFPSIGISSED